MRKRRLREDDTYAIHFDDEEEKYVAVDKKTGQSVRSFDDRDAAVEFTKSGEEGSRPEDMEEKRQRRLNSALRIIEKAIKENFVGPEIHDRKPIPDSKAFSEPWDDDDEGLVIPPEDQDEEFSDYAVSPYSRRDREFSDTIISPYEDKYDEDY